MLWLHAPRAGADVLVGSVIDDAGIGILVDGQTRLNLAAGRDGFPGLGISDARGHNRILLGLDRKESPNLVLRREDGNPAFLARTQDPILQLMDEQHKVLLSMPTRKGVR